MNRKHVALIVVEVLVFLFFLLYLFPFLLIVLNSAKSAFDVSAFPLALPKNWLMIFTNMASIWTNPNLSYPSSFVSSIIITVFSVVVLNLLCSQAAWVLVRTKTRFSQLIFLLFVGAMVIPFQIIMFPLLSWFRELTNLTGIGLLRTRFGMIFAYTGFGLSLTVFLFHGFIKGVPYELEEAATIDGSGKFGVFYRIVFPLLSPIHATVVVLNGMWIWNDYLLPLLVLGKGNRVQTIPLAVANFAGAYVKQWDLMLTAIVMAIIPIIVLFLAAQRYIIKGIVAGSIK
ncbi:MAG TPA: carbohydrate ABC transporter permease [Spirochaetia bacterium]|nr:carbohydrate ABC transporter permease [Spirochaetia bacterium]